MGKFNVLLCAFVCGPLAAQTLPTTIRVSNEIVPPGGMAQVKVLLTSPKPITTGNMSVDLSGVFFDSIDGIALFSPTGDVVGAATVQNGRVNVHFTSPNSTFGSSLDYPILTIALRLSNNVVPGQRFPVILDPSASIWQDLLGASIPFEFQQGSVTVGGSLSITDVVPGGGILAPGATVSILGTGFLPNTKVSLRGMSSSAQYISPNEFRATVHDGGLLDGTLVQAQNPDNITDAYYSYMRGVPQGVSTRPLLASTVPVFSLRTATEAVLPPTISSQVNPDYFTAIALENPSPGDATVTVDAMSGANAVLASTTIVLPNHARISREVSELFGFVLPANGFLHLTSSQPVQVVGLLGRDSTGVVLPIAPVILAGPPAPAPPPTTTSGGGGGGSGGGGGTGGGGGGGGKGTGTP